MKATIEIIDSTDLAEWANGDDAPLGVIPLEFGSVMDTDFLETMDARGRRIAYMESDYVGMGGFFYSEQGISAVLATIADCLANQGEECTSEFVIPISAEDRIYLCISIGELPSRGE